MKKMMMNCKEVVKTISSEERPSWRRRLEIRFHLMICHHCRKYAEQLDHLRASMKKVFRVGSFGEKSEEVKQLEEKILKSFNK